MKDSEGYLVLRRSHVVRMPSSLPVSSIGAAPLVVAHERIGEPVPCRFIAYRQHKYMHAVN